VEDRWRGEGEGTTVNEEEWRESTFCEEYCCRDFEARCPVTNQC